MENHDMLSAQASLWNQTFSFLNSMCLRCAIELDIPNTIHNQGQPMTLSELHAALSLPINNKTNLERLLRMLTHTGFLIVVTNTGTNKEIAYDLSPISSRLLNNDKLILLLLGFILVKPSFYLSDWLKQDKLDIFEMAHGYPIWELTGKLPAFNSLLNEGMASDSSFISDFVVNENSNVFQGISSLVDVGGGSGAVAISIANAFPNIKCTVFDLPQVVGHLPTDGAVKFVTGDMFTKIPHADAVLLKWVLHDWNDEDCIKILQRCKEAIASRDAGSNKVIIIDIVVGSANTIYHEAQVLFDMFMMTAINGMERDENEWCNLFQKAGFNSYKIIATLGVRSIIEVYP